MKKTSMTLFALLVVGVIVSAGAASAFGGGWMKNENIENAIADNDFEGWKAAVIEHKQNKLNAMTDEDFQKVRERHQERAEMMEKFAPVHEALENKDYDAFVEAAEELELKRGHLNQVTEENFEKFADMHIAMQNGDFETSKALREELGLEGFGKKHGKFGNHMTKNGFKASAEI